MDEWVLEEVSKVLPENDGKGRYFWQSFVERIDGRLSGLQGPEVGESFVRQCVAAGCAAVPVARRNSLWERDAPDVSERDARGVYELRIRLALFFAGCLRHLVQGVGRLRVQAGDREWYPVMDGGVSFAEFAAAAEGKVEVTWSKPAPDFGEAYFLASAFLPPEEALMLTPGIAREVLNYVRPDDPGGLFGMMMYDEGLLESVSVDVATVFLEALAECVEKGVSRVNTRMGGHVFITPELWLLTTPKGLDRVTEYLRTRRDGSRHDFSRQGIFEALSEKGCLVEGNSLRKGNASWICVVDVVGWDRPLELHGLPIRAEALPTRVRAASLFEGTVNLKRENPGGIDEE